MLFQLKIPKTHIYLHTYSRSQHNIILKIMYVCNFLHLQKWHHLFNPFIYWRFISTFPISYQPVCLYCTHIHIVYNYFVLYSVPLVIPIYIINIGSERKECQNQLFNYMMFGFLLTYIPIDNERVFLQTPRIQCRFLWYYYKNLCIMWFFIFVYLCLCFQFVFLLLCAGLHAV